MVGCSSSDVTSGAFLSLKTSILPADMKAETAHLIVETDKNGVAV
jgi:hypothetical protein